MQITKIGQAEQGANPPVVQGYLDAKAAADRANHNLKVAQEQLLDHMTEKQMKSVVTQKDGVRETITYVKRENISINEKGLRRKLTAKVYDKYTVRKLDRKAMEDAMERGDLDPMVVAPFVNTEPTTAYLKYTVKEVNDE